MTHLRHRLGRNAPLTEVHRRAGGGQNAEAVLREFLHGVHEPRAVFCTHRDEHSARDGRAIAGLDLRLGIGAPEFRVDPHHLSGALHLGSQQSVGPWELHERKHRLLHRIMPRPDLLGEVQLGQALPHHHQGGDLRQRSANRLGDERHGAGSPRVHLDDEHLAALDRVLDIHESEHAQFQSELSRRGTDLVDDRERERVRRQRAG